MNNIRPKIHETSSIVIRVGYYLHLETREEKADRETTGIGMRVEVREVN